jgi:hypothetical protein
MIKLRMDVDYPYPSRCQSFLFTVLNRKTSKDYLKNPKIIAQMVNESPREVKAYWFFTPQTTPDKEMLELLNEQKQEVALHVANDPYTELQLLEKATERKVKYYTVHGTARLFARLMWRRKIWESRAQIPEGFPLKNFWDFPTLGLDLVCYANPSAQAFKIAEKSIAKGEVLHIHPEWLFQRGTINHRGPYYEILRTILEVDKELEGLIVRKKGFAKIAGYAGTKEYERDFVPNEAFMEKLADRGLDVFTFVERKWCFSISNLPSSWVRAEDNVGLMRLTSFREWWDSVGKKTRNMVRKAEKSGLTTSVVEPTDAFAEGIWKIYNETPIRQGRAFSHYREPLVSVRNGVLSAHNSTFIGAFLQDELVGFVQLVEGDNIAIISQILSLQKFWDKAINNALVAKALEVCTVKQIQWIMYGRMGNHPSLDNFKQSNGFGKFALIRYYVPLTRKGLVVTKLGMHREIKDAIPERVKYPLIPLLNWVSRTKMKIHSR